MLTLDDEEAFLPAEVVAALPFGACLGEGQSARVLASVDPSGRPLALKVGRPGHEAVFIREAQALALCGGQFAPRLRGIGKTGPDGAPTLAMAIAEGRCLSEHLRASRSDRPRLAAAVLVKGAQALVQLHAWGLCHGDFKPDNLYVTQGPAPHVTLIDFGLSRRGGSIDGGTPRYLPPEVLRGADVSGPRADGFALAMTVAEILLPGPFACGSSPEVLADLLPEPFRQVLTPLLSGHVGTSPELLWLLDEAAELPQFLGYFSPEDVVATVRREYVATRLDEVFESDASSWDFPSGLPGRWIRELLVTLAAIRRHLGDGGEVRGPVPASADLLGGLSAHDRRRFLGRVVGARAAGWTLRPLSDDRLVDRLLSLGSEKKLRSILYSDLVHAHEGPAEIQEWSPAVDGGDQLQWALALGRHPVPRGLLVQIASSPQAAPELRLTAGRLARLSGEPRLSLRLLADLDSGGARLERAMTLARLGQKDAARGLYDELVSEPGVDDQARARAHAHLARLLLDEGDPHASLQQLGSVPACAATEEVRALAVLQTGDGEQALRTIETGAALAEGDEERARVLGVRGMVEHHLGQPQAACESFSKACDLSERIGAALEEASYATGLAAACTDRGHLAGALRASERAERLFESLGLPGLTARALLARAAVLSSLGASHELESVVRRGLGLCAQTGDRLCEAYLQFCLTDGASDPLVRLRAAERGVELTREGSTDDRLRAQARLLLSGGQADGNAEAWAESSTSREARVDWARARAAALEKVSAHSSGELTQQAAGEVVQTLLTLARSGPPLLSLGPALVTGAHLSLRIGLADEARALLAEARRVADLLLSHLPDGYRERAEALPWVGQAQGSRMSDKSGQAQLSDVEALLRALSQRRGFRALLDQVLDLLLLWTGVQRGLLLLRAPGGKLVIRAARNLDKNDLSPEQRQLSFSMAEKAQKEGRPVVAVDAVNDISAIHRSVHALHLRSVLAVPLAARGEILGVVYLDDRVRRGAFGERELSWVGLIGTVAALAIADERDRLGLLRALRKTERAERRLSTTLTHREAELEIAERELSRMQGSRKLRGDYSAIIGRSRAMNELLGLVDRVAQSDVPALVLGESGTGKELIARAIASAGPRCDKPFVAENCSAVPETLLESTLFGHQKGAFTGATRNQPGLFELAHRGTLFLDEIGDMSLGMQTKLLRVLQDGEVRALGSDRVRHVDVRVLVATHKDLKGLVAEGVFREDLYYRLNVITLNLPALRERPEDIPELVRHFLAKYSPGNPRKVSSAALQRLTSFHWPGNVRQLENEIRRMLVLGGDELTAADLSPEVLSDTSDAPQAKTLREKVDVLERRLVIEALERARGNRTRAAEALGLSRFGLQKMTQRLEIELPKNPSKAGRIADRGLDETQ